MKQALKAAQNGAEWIISMIMSFAAPVADSKQE